LTLRRHRIRTSGSLVLLEYIRDTSLPTRPGAVASGPVSLALSLIKTSTKGPSIKRSVYPPRSTYLPSNALLQTSFRLAAALSNEDLRMVTDSRSISCPSSACAVSRTGSRCASSTSCLALTTPVSPPHSYPPQPRNLLVPFHRACPSFYLSLPWENPRNRWNTSFPKRGKKRRPAKLPFGYPLLLDLD